MSYAYADRVVWLEELAEDGHPMVHDLCGQHAAAVRVPRGWELRDRWIETGSAEPHRGTPSRHDRFDLVGA